MRKLAFVLSGYIAGIAIAAIKLNIVTAIIASLLLAIFLRALFGGKRGFIVGTAVIIAFCVGAAQFAALKESKDDFLKWTEGKYITLYAKVDTLPEKSGEFYHTTVKAQAIGYVDKVYECSEKFEIYSKDKPGYAFCDTVKIVGKVEKPDTPKFKGAVDFNLIIRSDGSIGTMFVSGKYITRTGSDINLYDRCRALRYTIANGIEQFVPGEAKELLKGIATGDTSGFSDELQTAFAKSGISHITAVSGMNVTMLVSFVMVLFSFIGGPRKMREAVSIVMILIYAVISGLSASVIRASIMLIMALVASIFDRKEDLATSTVFAAALILFINPYSIFDIGFLLSFSAVIGIHLFSPYINALLRKILPNFIADIMGVTLCAQIATLPVMVYVFNSISIISPLTNLLVVPLIEALFIGTFVMLGAGWIVPVIGTGIGALLTLPANLIILVSKAFANLPFATVIVKTPNLIWLFTYVLILCIIYLSFKNKRVYKLPSVATGVMIALCLIIQIIPATDFEITFVNVGQGDCAYVNSATGEKILIDTGKNEYDAITFLKRNGISHIDKIFVTHIDADHSGGLESIIKEIDVDEVVLPKIPHTQTVLFGNKIVNAGVNVRYADFSADFTFGECIVDVIWPGETLVQDDFENNNSIGININYGGRNFLLMGDIGTAAEEIITEDGIPDADVIKIGHHGSKGSTSQKLLETAMPEYAVISVGENSYGHPDEGVLERLEHFGCEIYRTDTDGNITFTVDKNGTIKIK